MLLIIDNYDSFTYNLYQAVSEIHNNIKVFRNDKISIEEINTLNPKGIILSPGPKGPKDAGICIELVKALIMQKLQSIPLLGVCLGHQAITHALGGKVIQADSIWHGKEDLIHHHGKGIYANLPMPFKAARYHSLIADSLTLPKTLVVESYNDKNIIMGVRHVSLPMYGVQFHPESILTPQGNILIKNFLQICDQVQSSIISA